MLGLLLFAISTFSFAKEVEKPALKSTDGAARIAHFECFNLVRLIENFQRHSKMSLQASARLLESNETTTTQSPSQPQRIDQSIHKTLGEYVEDLKSTCSKLPPSRQAVCEDVLSASNVKKILDYLNELRRPDYICSQLGYIRGSPSTHRLINKDVCIKVINAMKSDVNRSSPFRRPIINKPEPPVSNPTAPVEKSENSTVSTNSAKAVLLEEPTATTPSASTSTTESTAKSTSTSTETSTRSESTSTSSLTTKQTESKTSQTTDRSSRSLIPYEHDEHRQAFIKRLSSLFRRGPRICESFETKDIPQCTILSRIAIRAVRKELQSQESAESICQKLEESQLIRLTDDDVGTLQMKRLQRRKEALTKSSNTESTA